MKEFNPKAIIHYQNTINDKNIKSLIKAFIKSKRPTEEHTLDIDYDTGTITYYDSHSDSFISVKFSSELAKLMDNITDEIKAEIELAAIQMNVKDQQKYWQSLLDSFNYIENHFTTVVSHFPEVIIPANQVRIYLKDKFGFPNDANEADISYFTILPKYNREHLKEVYHFLINNSFIDGEEVSFEDFYSVLNDPSTKKYLKFTTKTENVVCILELLSQLFNDFTRKRIEESERFRTKQGRILTKTNFDSTVSRISDKYNRDIELIRTFFLNITNR